MRFTPSEFLDHLLALPKLGGELVSPDLTWVAWTWYGRGPAADVYLAPTDGSLPPARLTDTPQDTSVVSWSADSRTLIVSEDKDGDERERLYAIDIFKPLRDDAADRCGPALFPARRQARAGRPHAGLRRQPRSRQRQGDRALSRLRARHRQGRAPRHRPAEEGRHRRAAAQRNRHAYPLHAQGPAPGRPAGVARRHGRQRRPRGLQCRRRPEGPRDVDARRQARDRRRRDEDAQEARPVGARRRRACAG